MFASLDPSASHKNLKPLLPLDEAGRERVISHLKLVTLVAWRFRRKYGDVYPFAELISEARWALVYASATYDTQRKVPFVSYAILVIRRRLIQIALGNRERQWHTRLPLTLKDLVTDRPPSNDQPLDPVDHRPILIKLEAILPKHWYNVLYWHYCDELSFTEIASRIGVSKQRVQMIANRALNRARERMNSSDSYTLST
jgi:RNA polymerase sigma factor (sigma-70 family)